MTCENCGSVPLYLVFSGPRVLSKSILYEGEVIRVVTCGISQVLSGMGYMFFKSFRLRVCESVR